MVSKSTEHWKNVCDGGEICFPFLTCAIFQEISVEREIENCHFYYNKEISLKFEVKVYLFINT